MRFLESHEGHSPTNNSLPSCPSQTDCQAQEEQEHPSNTPLQPEGSVIEVEEDSTLLHPEVSVVQKSPTGSCAAASTISSGIYQY